MTKNYTDSKESQTLAMFLSFVRLHRNEAEYTPWVFAQDFITVRRLARRLSNIDTHACNGTKYTDDAIYERATKRVYKELEKMLFQHGVHWYHQSDPRGASLYLTNQIRLTPENYTSGVAIY